MDELPVPPEDPDEWSDEQWLDWLAATDPAAGTSTLSPAGRPGRIARSAVGSVFGDAMMGLHHALYGRPDEPPAVVAEVPGEPDDEDGPEVHLDPDDPARSTAVVRHRKAGGRPRGRPPG